MPSFYDGVPDVYSMKLHAVVEIQTSDLNHTHTVRVLRVPGGWLYLWPGHAPAFVPYRREVEE
jgi:hypothetical protein